MRQENPELYGNTQFGAVVVAALAIGLVLCLLIAASTGWPWPLTIALVGLALLLFLFRSLTTVVTSEHLRVFYGPGLISRTIPRRDIVGSRVGRSGPLYGWGIRYWPGRGWMWNISGFDVVVLDLPGGRQFRVGTDDPEGLVDALRR